MEDKIKLSGPCFLNKDGKLKIFFGWKHHEIDLVQVANDFSAENSKEAVVVPSSVLEEDREKIRKLLVEKYPDAEVLQLETEEGLFIIEMTGPRFVVEKCSSFLRGCLAFEEMARKQTDFSVS